MMKYLGIMKEWRNQISDIKINFINNIKNKKNLLEKIPNIKNKKSLLEKIPKAKKKILEIQNIRLNQMILMFWCNQNKLNLNIMMNKRRINLTSNKLLSLENKKAKETKNN